jgi:pilus assembly protein CpaB
MSKQRTFIVLLLAIACGGLAGYSALKVLRERSAPVVAAEVPRSTYQVAVALRDLPVGHLLGEEDVKLVDWPGNALPDGYARTMPEVVGRGLITGVRMNEPLLDAKLADRSGQGGLPIVIPEGMRAVTVRADEVMQVAGFVTPGTRVDVLLTTMPPGGGEQLTKVVMQNVTVLTAAQHIQRDPEGKPMVVNTLTVLVTPEDGEKIIHAAASGRIQLSLRNMLDVKDARTQGARVSGLLSGGSAARTGGPVRAQSVAPTAQRQEPQSNTLEVYKGGVKALIRF